MYKDVSESFVQKVTSHSRTFRAKLIFEDSKIGEISEISDGIYSVSIKGGSCPDEALTLGNAVCTTADIDIRNTTAGFKGKAFKLELGLKLDDESVEYIPFGRYHVRSATAKENKLTLTVADSMYKADKTYVTSLSYPVTAYEVVAEISKKLGVECDLDDVMAARLKETTIPFAPSAKATMREMLGKVAALVGTNVFFNRLGKLAFHWYEESGYATDLDYISNPDIDEQDFTVEYLSCIISDRITETLGDDKSETGIIVENEFALEESLKKLWEQVKGFSYRPAAVKMLLGDPRIDPWDIVGINMGDKVFETIPMQLETSYDGGLSCTLTATAPDTDSDYMSPAEIAKAKQSETNRNISLVLHAQNDREVQTDGKEVLLLTAQFSTGEAEALPYFIATVQTEQDSSGIIAVAARVDESSHKTYTKRAAQGSDIMNFASAVPDLPVGSHKLELYLSADTAVLVEARQAEVIIAGNGLVAKASWDGNIVLSDVFENIKAKLLDIRTVNGETKAACKTALPQKAGVSETIPPGSCNLRMVTTVPLNSTVEVNLS